MDKDDLILVSVDDHVVESPDVFENHLPARYQEVAPELKERDDGTLAWYFYEHEITNVGLNAVAGRPRNDDEISGALVRAYNDWHVYEWCDTHPGRFIPLGIPMIWSAAQTAADLVWSRVLKEFPDIKIALSEGGIGWVPYFLDRIERTYDMHRHWTGQDLGELTPSERFLANVLLCFISDPVGVHLVDRIGSRNVCWEMDYPHSDSAWPFGPEDLHRDITSAGLSTEDIDNITHRTAMAWFSYDPFAHVSRERANVGALRASAAGHDIVVRSMGRGGAGPVEMDIGEMSKIAHGR